MGRLATAVTGRISFLSGAHQKFGGEKPLPLIDVRIGLIADQCVGVVGHPRRDVPVIIECGDDRLVGKRSAGAEPRCRIG